MSFPFFFQAEDGIRDSSVTGVQTCAFFIQAEDGIRDSSVTGVQTCALPIFPSPNVILADEIGTQFKLNCVPISSARITFGLGTPQFSPATVRHLPTFGNPHF